MCAPTAGPTRYRSSSPTKAELASLAASSSRQARSPCFAGSGAFGATLLAAILLSAGTALVHPTLIAAVSDAVQPIERAPAVGVYRFWRDFGFVVGALISGLAADALGAGAAIALVAALTAGSGLWVAATPWTGREALSEPLAGPMSGIGSTA